MKTSHPKGENYLLQVLDCNCNDCKFMERDFIAYNEKLNRHNDAKLKAFNLKKERLLQSGSEEALREVSKMRFQPDSKINEGFGFCTKFEKRVSFIPSICMIETQKCFVHRKD